MPATSRATRNPDQTRYAVYYAPPPGCALDRFGWRWFGRGAERTDCRRRAVLPGIDDAERSETIAEPFRYGFHATLKAPFRLAFGRTEAELLQAATDFASRPPSPGGRLHVTEMSGFLALRPDATAAIDALAGDCVRAFDRFRRPADDAELARRRAAGLTPAQDALLRLWGYPYVFEEFRFHMTLTAPLPPARLMAWRRAAESLASVALAIPFAVTGLCVFKETAPGARFRLVGRFPFSG